MFSCLECMSLFVLLKLNLEKISGKYQTYLILAFDTCTLLVPIPDKVKKLSWIFIFTLLCGALKSFMKALKAFIKPFEAPRRNVKKKFDSIFISIQLSEMNGSLRVSIYENVVRYLWSCRKNDLIRKLKLISKFLTSQPG